MLKDHLEHCYKKRIKNMHQKPFILNIAFVQHEFEKLYQGEEVKHSYGSLTRTERKLIKTFS